MKFIPSTEIRSGDVVAWAYSGLPAFTTIEGIKREATPPSLIYYEVNKVVPVKDLFLNTDTVVVYGKSFSQAGARFANLDRDWDLVPGDGRGVLLISRKENG